MYPQRLPALTTDQMIEVDRAMIEDYHIGLIQMMENAGRNLAHLARVPFLHRNPAGKQVVIMAGTGGNGGGALVCARRLHNWGARVHLFLSKPADIFTPIPARQLDILQRMQVPAAPAAEVAGVKNVDLVVDGLIGYSLAGAPRGSAARLIRWANAQDAPSGLDTTSGMTYDPAIWATVTMTLALPKQGLLPQKVADPCGGTLPGRHQRAPRALCRTGPGLQGGYHLCSKRYYSAAIMPAVTFL